ncbi:GGDEF domain-containing protein [Butyrivibrio sp. AE3004]|uniref:GGDEF domain-containing protein n=1 Tax=Butyrivibrio sp. AE3004 TaxID=1506994 RepID=UPI000493CABE|nr:GGDEF domain-containing protein [Butyrivibrio sp. AE3004]
MLKKHSILFANIIVILLIIVVSTGLQINEYTYYKNAAIKQAREDVAFTSSDISYRLTIATTEQLVASQMMANDIFLKIWAEDEISFNTDEHKQLLYDYLNEYKQKYNYDVVFFVSNQTYNYYYDGGLNKVVSPTDDFDIWYFNFLDLHQEYDIQIDHDEVNDFSVTLFVNCLVTDESGNILGVVGVGNQIDDFQNQLENYVSEYDLNICIVNKGNAHNSFTGSTSYYKTVDDATASLGLSRETILMDVDDDGYAWNEGNLCTKVMRNKALNWNIFVQSDITKNINILLAQMNRRIVLLMLIILSYLMVSLTLFSRLNRITYESHNTDELTRLANNRLFREKFNKENKRKFSKETASLFMLDVDDFKSFNDTRGHLYGNAVLQLVSQTLKENVGETGFVGRWGGDEFIGVIYDTPEKAKVILDNVQNIIRSKDTAMPISFSCGISQINSNLTLEKNMELADRALYKSKENGKAQSSIYSP